MGVQHKGGMYNMKRVIALLLTLVMLLGLVPTALAAEAAAPDGTVVKAEEVSGTPPAGRHSPGSEKGFCRDPGGPARRSPGGGHPHCLCP